MTRLEKGTLYNEDMRGITTSSPVFEHLIQHNLTYVDKTKYIHSLVSSTQSSFYFVSRPRRWGKSLFCYTLESLFKGARDLFKGLYIYDKYDFNGLKESSSLQLTRPALILMIAIALQ